MVKRKGCSLVGVLLLTLLSICFMAIPSHAYGASDTESQDVYLSAWINGESMYILATSPTGIDAVFIDEARINYRVDDVLVLSLKEHTDKETLKIYATDFNGKRSDTQTLHNPFYQAPKTSSSVANTTTSKPKTPAVSSVPMVASTPTASTPIETETTRPLTESTPSASTPTDITPTEAKPFTPEGNGETVDNATGEDGKEFFTITTPDGNIFYLVIDRQRGNHDVYFLNAVTENDLLALAEKSETSSEDTSPPAPSTPEPTENTSSEIEKEPTPEKKKGNNNAILMILLVVAVGGAAYYFKVLKPKSKGTESFDEDDEDEFDEEYDEYNGQEESYLDENIDEIDFDENIDETDKEEPFNEETDEWIEE